MIKEEMTLREVAVCLGVLRDSVYAQVRKKRMKAHQKNRRWYVNSEAVVEFLQTKYSRDFIRMNGELIYDIAKGEHSIKQAAKMMGVPYQHICYLIRKGYLRAKKKSCHHVIMREDIEKYMQKFEDLKKIVNN